MNEWFHWEGPLMDFLEKTGQLIVVSCLWILGCLPVITIGASTTALYYAVVKAVRRGQGSPVEEFLRSFRSNLLRGTVAVVPALVLAALLSYNLQLLIQTEGSVPMRWATALSLGVVISAGIYLCPVLSRFTMKVWPAWKLSFVMAIRFFPYTLGILAGSAALAAAQFYILPMPTLAILPGAACFAVSFWVEKALRFYMPPKGENDNSWYYEN